MSENEDIAYMESDKLLEQVDLGKLDIVESHIDDWQDMLEELLSIRGAAVLLAPADDTLSTSGMAPCECRVGRCGELHSGVNLCQGPSPLSYLWVR